MKYSYQKKKLNLNLIKPSDPSVYRKCTEERNQEINKMTLNGYTQPQPHGKF